MLTAKKIINFKSLQILYSRRTENFNSMQKFSFLCFIFLSMNVFAQVTPSTQKALNNQMAFINQSTKEVQSMVKSFQDFYQSLNSAKKDKRRTWLSYKCPSQLDAYYYEQAQDKSGSIGTQLKTQSEKFRKALETVDEKCKAIEVYVRLKDYEKDNLEGGFKLISDIQPLVLDFRKVKEEYESKIQEIYQKSKTLSPNPAYVQCEKNMRTILEKDKKLINSLTCNFNEDIHTGWAKEEIQKNINEIDILLEEIQKNTPKISYPASSYYSSFVSCALDFQKNKKYTIDQYNFEAQQSDKHANDAYWSYINYYDGCIASFFNLFVDFTEAGNLFPLKVTNIAPTFEIKNQSVIVDSKAKFFQDIPYQAFEVKTQNSAISPALNNSLNKYIDFINEGIRLCNNLLRSLANQDVTLTNFDDKKTFYYYNKDLQLPQTLFQETLLANRNLPENTKKSISSQAEVLFSILKEMSELNQEVYLFASKKTFQAQGFKRLEEIRDRYKILYETFDKYKERLFLDLKKIFDSYKFADAQNSWTKSYLVISEVVQDDKDLLLIAKKYFKGEESNPIFNTDKLNTSMRSLIANEFTNMKGIERIGRNHGLCPYNPYEDVGTYSQQFMEYPKRLNNSKYEDFTYKYNSIVYEKNRFVDLAKIPLLKEPLEMDLFLLKEPYKRETRTQTQVQNTQPTITKTEDKPQTKTEKVETKGVEAESTKVIAKKEKIDTVKVEVIKKETVIVKETVIRDTVYIRDTIYLEKPPPVTKDFYTLEGYAPNNLVLLLDVSSSMNAPDRLPLLQTSAKKLVSLFREEDEIAIVVYSGTAQVILPSTSGKEKAKIIKAIESLEPRGKTDANAGLTLAYKVANQKFKYAGNNKIILASDGEFGLRPVVMDLIGQNANAGISLTIFKFGEKPTPSLKQISDKGKGNLVSITSQNAEAFMINEAKKKK